MPAATLQTMAIRALAHRGRDIHDFGVCPVHLLQPVLPKITNPDQLRTLEQNSPQILGHTREVWLSMLKRDIPFWKERLPRDWETTIFAPENAGKWHRIYFKLKSDVEAEKERSRRALVQELEESAAARGPETVVRTREPLYLGDGKKRQRKSYNDAKYALNKDMYSKTKGESFFDKVKRNAVTKSVSKRIGPTRTLKPVLAREIKRAPLGMVEDIKESKEAVVRNVGLPPSDGKRSTMTTQTSARQDQINRKAAEAAGVTKLTIDFLEDDDDDDGDTNMSDHDSDNELFGISKPTKRTAVASVPPPRKKLTTTIPSARTASPLKRRSPPTNVVSAAKRYSPPARTASPLTSVPAAASKAPAPTQGSKVIKRTKTARSIFAKK